MVQRHYLLKDPHVLKNKVGRKQEQDPNLDKCLEAGVHKIMLDINVVINIISIQNALSIQM